MPICGDSHLRLMRAAEHASTVVNSYLRFLNDEPKPFGITHEMRDDRNGVIRLVPNRGLKTDLPLILGEFFYHLRAALDGAMWKAYKSFGGTTSKRKEEHLYFPLCKSPAQFKDATFHAIPLPDDLKNWLESIQPYNAKNLVAGTDHERIAKSLWLVNESAKERHRTLHIIATVVSGNTALIECTPPAVITYVRNLPARPLEGQYEIAAFGVEGMTAETELTVNFKFTLEVTAECIPENRGMMIGLFQLIDDVRSAVRRFDVLLK